MKKLIAWISAVCILVGCMVLPVGAASTINGAPNPKVEYSYTQNTPAGTIRYMSQMKSSKYFNSNYWGGNWLYSHNDGVFSGPESECGTCSISMALSYIGINQTPKNILDTGNGSTYFGRNWGGATYISTNFSTAINNYINGQGKYSPPIIHLANYSPKGHFVVIAGKVSSTKYLVVDPANENTWSIEINGNQATYIKGQSTKQDAIGAVTQYYNPNANPTPKGLTISGSNTPGTLIEGNVFSISGTVQSGSTLKSVSIGCYDINGNAETIITAIPRSTSYNIKESDDWVFFNDLKPGVYTYRVSATNATETKDLVNKKFIVLAKNATIKDGTYSILASNKSYAVGIAGNSNNSGANVQLVAASDSAYQNFQITHVGSGYYTIRNVGSGKYLDVAGASSSSGTNVQQFTENGSPAQKWQILPVGRQYCLVPQCGNTLCLDVYNGSMAAGTNLHAFTANLSEAQLFYLTEIRLGITVTTKDAVDITDSTAGLPGSYYNPAAMTVTEYGAVYGTSKDNLFKRAPLARNESYVNGGIPAYVVKGLDPAKTYYYMSYVKTGNQAYYGDVKSFTTSGVSATANAATEITATSAVISGTYYNPKGLHITECGIEYIPNASTGEPPILKVSASRNETSVNGVIPNLKIEGLKPGMSYSYWPYVIANGKKYCNPSRAKWLEAVNDQADPSVPTVPVTPDSIKVTANAPQNITATSASLSGSYYNPDGLKILEYGARYGTEKDKEPNIYAGFITADKTDINGTIPVCTAENLQPNTTYYYYTFVTTKQYMHCSEIKSFTTTSTGEVTPPTSEVHFPKAATYTQGQFTDVAPSQWFTKNVAAAVEFGLMKGSSPTTFNPYGDVTLAEAITMAARIHSIYTTGSENFTQASGQAWYQVYLDYAYQNGIINYSYYTRDVKQRATRAEYAEIFANALPDAALYAKNTVVDNAIPDVKMSDSYAGAVYKLYRAGILAGGDVKGTFSPLTYITRAESATIVSRMADSDNRMDFSL